ncbi:putative imidazolonepropionase [Dermatophagoides pteronyssinus]|uniref:Probable imidazolonepropionase n=1 Tax=Dermatophagoides pteronyssinus TaxID=6956 RepID=A0ABQ8JBA0_DERPT|nr:putative imidazolonepropionase [Dermatophagoides pteronyssinus]
MMTTKPKTAIVNCEQIVTICSNHQQFLAGKKQDIIESIERRNQIGVSIVFADDGRIMAIDYHDRIDNWLCQNYGDNCWQTIDTIDGNGCSLIPGLIDSHSHPIWAGDRIDEFDRKLRGETYMQIHESGGGINYTVRETKRATESELLQSFLQRINHMISCGTTILECKTGYGLDYECERKMLRVIQQASTMSPIQLVPTFLGAHSIPSGMTADQGVEHVCTMMEQLSRKEPELKIEFFDVFCETGVYNHKQTEQILRRAKELYPKSYLTFHGDELSDQDSGRLAAKISAHSISHLEYLNTDGIEVMANRNIAAIINPTTCYLLKLRKPPVREMIANGVPIVIATDYNPNALCYSLPMAMNLATIHLGMTLNESLIATTLNAAYALNRSNDYGSLEIGKLGNCLLLNCSDWRHLIAEFGHTSSLIRNVIINGKRIQ